MILNEIVHIYKFYVYSCVFSSYIWCITWDCIMSFHKSSLIEVEGTCIIENKKQKKNILIIEPDFIVK